MKAHPAIAVPGIVLCVSSTGLGISRVGNPASFAAFGFEASVPDSYRIHSVQTLMHEPLVELIAEDGAMITIQRLTMTGSNPSPRTRSEQVSLFRGRFPGYSWGQVLTEDHCAQGTLGVRGHETVALVSWGPASGIELRTTGSEETRQAVMDFLSSIHLQEGQCQW